jgi:dihydrofolate reductase
MSGRKIWGVDNDLAARGFNRIGAWIIGRNMFGPVRGPWPDDEWKGWWRDNPPFHTPVFVLTNHARSSIPMEGGTVFHFVTDGIRAALARATEAANCRARISGHANQRPIVQGTGKQVALHLKKTGFRGIVVIHSKNENGVELAPESSRLFCATGQTNSQASHYHLFHERQEEEAHTDTILNERSGLPMHNVHVRERKPRSRGQAQGGTGKTEAAKTHCSKLTIPAEGVEALLFGKLSCLLPLKSGSGFCG